MTSPAASEWSLQFRGSLRFHMLQCWMDSLESPWARAVPGCVVNDAFAEGRDAQWAVYVHSADAVRAADAGRAFIGSRDAVAGSERSAVAARGRCRRAAGGCAAAAR